MASLIMPISLLVKHYITVTGNMYLSEIIVYLLGFLAICVLFAGKRQNTIGYHNLLDSRVLLILALFLLVQFAAMTMSYYGTSDNSYLRNPLRGMVSLLVFLFFVFFHYLILRIMIISDRDIKFFLKGSLISTIILLFVTYSQQLYLTFPGSMPLNKLMSFYGTYFEARDSGAKPWYINGSLVQTLYRINGFFTESAMLAAQIAIICLPFVLAAIKNKYDLFLTRKYSTVFYHLLLVLLLGMLLLAKTSTGILAIAVAVIVFWVLLPWKRKINYGILFGLLLILGFIVYKTNNNVNSIINTYTFGKASNSFSTSNRIGNTIALFETFLHRPLFGTGFGYTYHYLLSFTPKWSTNNTEFADFVNVRHSIPLLSILTSWLAQYGVIFVSLFVGYILKIQYDTFQLIKKQKDSKLYKLYKTIGDSSLFFFLIFLPLSFFNFGWNEPSFLFMFFFYVIFRQYLYQKTYQRSLTSLDKVNGKHLIRWFLRKKIQ